MLGAADVHVARALARLVGEDDDAALLAAALAVRAPRLGHVCVDLADVRESAVPADDSAPGPLDLPWPEPAAWVARLRAERPASASRRRRPAARRLAAVPRPLLARGARGRRRPPAAGRGAAARRSRRASRRRSPRLFPGPALRRAERGGRHGAPAPAARRSPAARAPARRRRSRASSPCWTQVEGLHPRRVALAAPTGKAAARLEEAVHDEAAAMAVGDETRARLLAVGGSTLHRLLGRRPDSDSRFRHDRANRLPHTSWSSTRRRWSRCR